MDPETLRSLNYLLTERRIPSELPGVDSESLLRMGAVLALEQECRDPDNSAAARILATAAILAPDPQIKDLALTALGRCSAANTYASAELYRLAVVEGSQAAAAAITYWQVSSPEESLLLIFNFLYQPDWKPKPAIASPNNDDYAQIIDFYFESDEEIRKRILDAARQRGLNQWLFLLPALVESSPASLAALINRFPSLSPENRATAVRFLEKLAKNRHSPAQDALCELCIQHEDEQACLVAKMDGLSPSDPIRRALYFFLSGDYQAYETTDFSHTLLPAAYETASPNLRQRLLARSRTSGHIEWLSRQRPLFALADLSEKDWMLVIEQLAREKRQDDLIRLAFNAPPLWSARILADYSDNEPPFAFDDPSEWSQLVWLARQAGKQPVQLFHEHRITSAEAVNALSVSPDERWLALAGSEAHIQLVRLPEGKVVPPLSGPVARTLAVAFSADGAHLISSGAGHALRIFRLEDGQLVKTLSGHTAPVRAIAVHPSGRVLFSAAFDGTVRAWRFPHGPEIAHLPVGAEVFGLALVDGGRTVAIAAANGCLIAWHWEEDGNQRALVKNGPPLTALAGRIADVMAAAYSRDQELSVWNVSSARQTLALSLPGTLLTTLALLPDQPVLVAGFYDGSIKGYHATGGQQLFEATPFSEPVVGLAYLQASRRLVSAAGEEVNIDSMSGLLALRMPLERQDIQAASTSPALPDHWRRFIAALLKWKTRYDIQISETGLLPVGEFDIQL